LGTSVNIPTIFGCKPERLDGRQFMPLTRGRWFFFYKVIIICLRTTIGVDISSFIGNVNLYVLGTLVSVLKIETLFFKLCI
jgi:hypothetical protein